MQSASTSFSSQYLNLALSPEAPAFTTFALDSLGQGKLLENPVLDTGDAVKGIRLDGGVYTLNGHPVWRVSFEEKTIRLQSRYVPGVEAPPFILTFNQKTNHATLLGLMKPGEMRMQLPCLLHLPDMGSARISCDDAGAMLDYDARRWVPPSAFVQVSFPPASASQPQIEYRLDVVAIHPDLPGIAENPLYDGFRRDWLNIFQVNPRLQRLANNASSDACSFTLFEYSNIARHTPPLAEGLTCLDLIRMSLDRYLAGELGYGQVGYAEGGAIGQPYGPLNADLVPWGTPWTSLDTLPSLLIAACDYVEGSGDLDWGHANFEKLAQWAREMFAADKNGNGLIEYPHTGNFGDRPTRAKRPGNWWDTINFGHEDAFSNALAYRAGCMAAELASRLERQEDAAFFAAKAEKLRAAYAPTFLNPETGVLAGWKSADGKLHDYWFTYVQGLAVTFGLLDRQTANSVMDRIFAKMEQVGYKDFSIGIPGNLVPAKKGDYVDHEGPPEEHGVPQLEDGSDGFQFYENGGATGCWAYYIVKALFDLDRVDDARRIFHPMLAAYARGEFQGFGPNGMSRDWRDWQGGCHGYEGLLVDNYHALLAVLDDIAASHS